MKNEGNESDRVFPTFVPNKYGGEGLTKRELFAAMAMQGELAAARDFKPAPEYVAEIGVRCADALIAALERGPGTEIGEGG